MLGLKVMSRSKQTVKWFVYGFEVKLFTNNVSVFMLSVSLSGRISAIVTGTISDLISTHHLSVWVLMDDPKCFNCSESKANLTN